MDATPANASTDRNLDLLAAGIPLSLLVDLVLALDSREIYREEGGSAHWLRRVA